MRYDGNNSANAIVIDKLGNLFELVPVCPEVEAGLPIPRPPVQLSNSIENPQLLGRDDPTIDITSLMQNYCNKRVPQLDQLSGFVFKSRSPSCGLNSTPVFINDKCVTEQDRGVFARTFTQHYPQLPVIEETELESAENYERFTAAVMLIARM